MRTSGEAAVGKYKTSFEGAVAAFCEEVGAISEVPNETELERMEFTPATEPVG